MHCPVSDILQQPCKVETVTAVVIVSYDLFLFLAVLGLHWASLVAQMVKNPPSMQETWVFTAAWGPLSSCGAQALGTWASVAEARRLICCSSRALKPRLHSCGAQAKLLWSLQDHPSSGIVPCLLHWQVDSLSLSHHGSPCWYYLRGDETETQRGFVTWPRSHSK